MKWLRDLWHGKPDKPHVFIRLNPESPHQGVDHFSASEKTPYEHSIKVLGMTPERARLELVGKVLEWSKLSDRQWKDIEGGKPPNIEHEQLKLLFR